MWWQIIPSLSVVTGVCVLPFFTLPTIHYVVQGRPSMRELTEGKLIDGPVKLGWLRDWNLVGNNWTAQGLDAIPDE